MTPAPRHLSLLLLFAFIGAMPLSAYAQDAPTTQRAEQPRQQHAQRIDHLAADEPANMLPDSTGAFIQVNDLAKWRREMADDPVMQSLLQLLPGSRDHFPWLGLQQTLGIDGDDIIDGYCGKRVVIAGSKPGKGNACSLILRVNPEHSQLAVQRLSLEPIENAGAFQMYSTHDSSTRIAVHKRWIALTRTKHEPDLRRLLMAGANGNVLAHDPQFVAWTSRLPEPRRAVAYFADANVGHAFAVTDDPAELSLHYVGRPPMCDVWFANLGEDTEPQWPHLPASALAALSINVKHGKVSDHGVDTNTKTAIALYNRDVVPNVASPFVVVGGHINLQTDDAQTPRAWPAAALVVRFADLEQTAKHANYLSNTLDGLVSAISQLTGQSPPVSPRFDKHEGNLYHIADLGNILATRMRNDDLKHFRLAYGRVGDWYVIATHEDFFTAFIDANAHPEKRLQANKYTCRKLTKPCGRAVATAFVRSQPIADSLQTWIDYWNQHHPATVELSQFKARSSQARIAKKVLAAQAFFRSTKHITARFHKDSEDNLVIGRIDVTRPNGK